MLRCNSCVTQKSQPKAFCLPVRLLILQLSLVLVRENLETAKSLNVPVSATIEAVADGITIDPTATFGEAYSWVNLNLNASMVDVDGSETMSIKLTGLGDILRSTLMN